MKQSIKVIQTVYKGYRFRSRLEARWAVFFDAAGIRYEYEPEGFDCGNGVYYLPDFYLPEDDVWVEIKAKALTDKEREKIDKFADAMCDMAKTGTRFRLLEGQIPDPVTLMLPDPNDPNDTGCICSANSPVGICCYMYWHKNSIERAFGQKPSTGALIAGVWTRPDWMANPQALSKALTKARQARFEHGERPEIG